MGVEAIITILTLLFIYGMLGYVLCRLYRVLINEERRG